MTVQSLWASNIVGLLLNSSIFLITKSSFSPFFCGKKLHTPPPSLQPALDIPVQVFKFDLISQSTPREVLSSRLLSHLRDLFSCGDSWYLRADMDRSRQEKVRKYEEFVDRRLKPDLVHAIAERDKVFEQQKIFSDLKRNIENLEKNSVTSLRTLVNLGSEVYMQADVPNTQHIFVDVGLGFHVEFTWPEALNFIVLREENLSRQIEEYTRLIASIKGQIKMVVEGIRELLQLPVTDL